MVVVVELIAHGKLGWADDVTSPSAPARQTMASCPTNF